MIDELLAPFGPSESALTALFRAEIDEDMLREIAEADYGEMADKCDALLQPILHDDLVVSGDPYLREVLELTRWLEPGDLDEKPVGYGPTGNACLPARC